MRIPAKLLANNSMLSILRRRLVRARELLAEEQAKNPDTMTSRQREARNEEIVGARNRILNLEQMIRREEEKERRLEESKKKTHRQMVGQTSVREENYFLN